MAVNLQFSKSITCRTGACRQPAVNPCAAPLQASWAGDFRHKHRCESRLSGRLRNVDRETPGAQQGPSPMTCSDPDTLTGLAWLACYLTTAKHISFYWSFGTVILTVALVAPAALFLGLMAALAKRSRVAPLRWIASLYTSMVRGIPDIIFFLFVPLALDQALEWTRHHILCPDVTEPIRRGNDFVVCSAAKFPLTTAPEVWHDLYGLFLALIAFAIVFRRICGQRDRRRALKAVPKGQLEAAAAIGMRPRQVLTRVHLPQMWRYALPGLSNIWQILIKATPLLCSFSGWKMPSIGLASSAVPKPARTPIRIPIGGSTILARCSSSTLPIHPSQSGVFCPPVKAPVARPWGGDLPDELRRDLFPICVARHRLRRAFAPQIRHHHLRAGRADRLRPDLERLLRHHRPRSRLRPCDASWRSAKPRQTRSGACLHRPLSSSFEARPSSSSASLRTNSSYCCPKSDGSLSPEWPSRPAGSPRPGSAG